MKKLALISLLIVITLSCKKEETYPDNPGWLNDMIAVMSTEASYAGTAIYAYEWNNDYYYHILIPISSCWMCEFYCYDGTKVIWTDDNISDFQKNGKKIKIVWERKI
jgi:hypothetical protein